MRLVQHMPQLTFNLHADILKGWPTRTLITLDVSKHATCRQIQNLMCAKVLLEAPFDPIRRQMNSVLLTIDLTKAVADEAIQRKDCVVVSYRIETCSSIFPTDSLTPEI